MQYYVHRLRHVVLFGCLFGLIFALHAEGIVTCVNLKADGMPGIAAAAGQQNLTVREAGAGSEAFSGNIIVWEATKNAAMNGKEAEIAARIGSYVRQGGSLLLTLGEDTGPLPVQLAFMLPTTAWQTQIRAGYRGTADGETAAAEWDNAFFPNEQAKGLRLRYYYHLLPVTAVERGEERLERYERPIPYLTMTAKAWEPFYTRPLLNRDWQVRVRANDVGHSGLLITGRYGAGRVAVFASGAREGSAEFWSPVLAWLAAAQPAAPVAQPAPSIATTIDQSQRTVRVTVHNPGDSQQTVQVIARMLTWENALIGDVVQPVTVGGHGTADVKIPLPTPGATNYQAIAAQDAYLLRIGVLSADGATQFAEQRQLVDLQPALHLSASLDNLWGMAYPFDAPGYNAQSSFFPHRMGTPTMGYAYPPKHQVTLRATIANGVKNLAPWAEAKDETNPTNAQTSALNDTIAQDSKVPRGGYNAWGFWAGKDGTENIMSFTFPQPVTMSAVTLIGMAQPVNGGRIGPFVNPGAVQVEIDGKIVAQDNELDARFTAEYGNVQILFTPVRGSMLRLRFPWVATLPDGTARKAPNLGEVEIVGTQDTLPSVLNGTLTFTLKDTLTGKQINAGTLPVHVQPGEIKTVELPYTPVGDANSVRYYQLVTQLSAAGIRTQSDAVPFMVLQPAHPLQPLEKLRPESAPNTGFIVTRGFRNVTNLGTGTRNTAESWSSPDDRVWAYARQLKQAGRNDAMKAGTLWTSSDNLSHYANPWTSYANGELLIETAAPNFVAAAKQDRKWSQSDRMLFYFGDRWDTGPATERMHTWPEYVEFDQYLRSQGLEPLKGFTRQEVADEIYTKYYHRFRAWQMTRYAKDIRALRDAFAQEGKRLIIGAQGMPLVPASNLEELSATIQGMSDDSTWGMERESYPYTTGRQMATLAFNPSWQLSTAFVYGWDSAVLNNPRWWCPQGTTESSRRHYYDRAWRGIVGADGQYRSMHTFGYGMNGYGPWASTANDYQEAWRLQERWSLLGPDGPLGAGIVVGTAAWEDPEKTIFSGGGMGGSDTERVTSSVASLIQNLHDAGVSVPFTSNVAAMAKWSGTAPRILLNIADFTTQELAQVKAWHQRGVHMLVFKGDGTLPADIAPLFGVTADGKPSTGRQVAIIGKIPVIEYNNSVFISGKFEEIDAIAVRQLSPLVQRVLEQPMIFPTGTAGYGFTVGAQRYIVVEDYLEQGRIATLRLHATPGAKSAHAVNVNDHQPLAVRREKDDWLIDFPTRPADGTLICIEEQR